MKFVRTDLKIVEIVDVPLHDVDKILGEFDPDVIIATNRNENVIVIEKSLSNLSSMALYKPDIEVIDILPKNRIQKVILTNNYIFKEYGEVVDNEEDYFKNAINMVYQIII